MIKSLLTCTVSIIYTNEHCLEYLTERPVNLFRTIISFKAHQCAILVVALWYGHVNGCHNSLEVNGEKFSVVISATYPYTLAFSRMNLKTSLLRSRMLRSPRLCKRGKPSQHSQWILMEFIQMVIFMDHVLQHTILAKYINQVQSTELMSIFYNPTCTIK